MFKFENISKNIQNNRNFYDKTGRNTQRDKQFIPAKSPKKSQTSISPSTGYHDKVKINKPPMKRSFTGANSEAKKEAHGIATSPDIKNEKTDRSFDKSKEQSKEKEKEKEG